MGKKLETKPVWIYRERNKAAKKRHYPTPASHSYTGVGRRRLGNVSEISLVERF